MKTAIAIGATLLLTTVVELFYEWGASKLMKREAIDHQDTMEQSINDGCQTSLRMLVFGVMSGVLVWSILGT